jgi:hypothetical protein
MVEHVEAAASDPRVIVRQCSLLQRGDRDTTRPAHAGATARVRRLPAIQELRDNTRGVIRHAASVRPGWEPPVAHIAGTVARRFVRGVA